jgi:hypothetical protein
MWRRRGELLSNNIQSFSILSMGIRGDYCILPKNKNIS